MRKEQGLKKLVENYTGNITTEILASLLMDDLKSAECFIFGQTRDDELILLTELNIIPDSLFYEQFDKRIEFTVAGEILNDQYVPLTYSVRGDKFKFSGRCSMIPRVCGVDLYLSSSYTRCAGDIVRQNFSVAVKRLVKTLNG